VLYQLPEIIREMMGLRTAVPSPDVDFDFIEMEEDYTPWPVTPVPMTLGQLILQGYCSHVGAEAAEIYARKSVGRITKVFSIWLLVLNVDGEDFDISREGRR